MLPSWMKKTSRTSKGKSAANAQWKQLRRLIHTPQLSRSYWQDELTLVVDMPVPVVPAHVIERSYDRRSGYTTTVRCAARTCCIHAFVSAGMKRVKLGSTKYRREAHDVCAYMLDRVHTIGLVRFEPEGGKLDSDSLLQSLHYYRDGAYDAIYGYSVSDNNRLTWLGQYADADHKEDAIKCSYNQLDGDPMLRIIYELRTRA